MALDDRAIEVLDALYEAAFDESRWPDALRRLAAFTDSQAASFWVLDRSEEPRLSTFQYVDFDPAFIREYLDRVAPDDPTVRYLVSHPDVPVVHDGMVISEREKDRHAYYDWHARHSETRFRIVGQARPAERVQAGVALHRTRKAGRFEPDDVARFAFVHRHLARVVAIGARLGAAASERRALLELLDRTGAAVVLVGRGGRVVLRNAAAERMTAAGDGVAVKPDGIALADPAAQRRLDRLVAQASSIRASATAAPGGSGLSRRPSGRRPYVFTVTPLSAHHPALSELAPAVCVELRDPEPARPIAPERVTAALGLTPAEGRLAALLAAGHDLRDAAAALEIGYGTARTRLGQIFLKTGTRRQAELVRLVVTCLAP